MVRLGWNLGIICKIEPRFDCRSVFANPTSTFWDNAIFVRNFFKFSNFDPNLIWKSRLQFWTHDENEDGYIILRAIEFDEEGIFLNFNLVFELYPIMCEHFGQHQNYWKNVVFAYISCHCSWTRSKFKKMRPSVFGNLMGIIKMHEFLM